ncbi:unnamed protein product, partial [Discosporangium mesarthrocarpum]
QSKPPTNLPHPTLPQIELRGCTPIGKDSSRYEINLGQQLAHPSSIEWGASLGLLPCPLEYRLYTLHGADAEWLTLGHKEGVLWEADVKEVTIYFNRSRLGVFSTYVVVENLANPADFKVCSVSVYLFCD